MGLEAAALPNFSQSGGMYISYSVVLKIQKTEDFDSCHIYRLFSGLAKKG
jgi:hypothetical protein